MSSPLHIRSLTPPEIAERLKVGTSKVTEWIRLGDLKALNLARRGCKRPRYTITPEQLAEFERSRLVIPKSENSERKLRRPPARHTKEFF